MIMKRISGDFGRSIEFRAQYNRVALSIWREFPVFGIGLNNFNTWPSIKVHGHVGSYHRSYFVSSDQ